MGTLMIFKARLTTWPGGFGRESGQTWHFAYQRRLLAQLYRTLRQQSAHGRPDFAHPMVLRGSAV
jgi:hypothetical protein